MLRSWSFAWIAWLAACQVVEPFADGFASADRAHGARTVATHAGLRVPDAVVLERVAAAHWNVTVPTDLGSLRYVLAQHGPADWRRVGATQIRLLELWWLPAGAAAELQLLQCGQCDALTAHAAADERGEPLAEVVWAGGGHGMESDALAVAWFADEVAVDLEVGERVAASAIELRHETILYGLASGADAGDQGPHVPLVAAEHHHRITTAMYQWDATWSALAPVWVALDYDVMLQGITICGGGPWDGVSIAGEPGSAASTITACPAPYGIDNYEAGSYTALVSTGHGVQLAVASSGEEGPYRVTRRTDSPHLKIYRRALEGAALVLHETRRYGHVMLLEPWP